MPKDGRRPDNSDETWMRDMAEGLSRAMHREQEAPSPVAETVLECLGPERTVLDIGAGVGRFAVPLARGGISLEAVEPSPMMRQYLEGNVREAGVGDRVRIIADAWPTEAAGIAEVALAAFVLQFADDPVAFVRAMERHSTRRVVVALHVDPLWGRFRDVLAPLLPPGARRAGDASFKSLLTALIEADIVPDVHIFEQVMGPRWSSLDEAESSLKRRFHQDEPGQQAALRQILEDHPEFWRTPWPVRAAILSWRPPG